VQMAKGNFSPVPVSVGDLFAGALLPSLMLIGLYVVWMIIKAIFDPQSCPATPAEPREDGRGMWREVLSALLPPMALIVAVLGSILGGIATATEAASVGAVGAMLLSMLRGRFTFAILRQVVHSTAVITSMVFVIILGAAVFSIVFRMMGGENLVHELISALPGGRVGAIFFVMALMFVLGFILDSFEIIFIVVPVTAPILLAMDVNPVWLGVMISMNLQTSFMTPPFGFSMVYLRGVAPASVTTGMMYRGVLPFVALQLLAVLLIYLFPGLATWLPSFIYS